MMLRRWLSAWTPPAIRGLMRRLRPGNRWSGNFPTWVAAHAASSGYAQADILATVESAVARVLSGDGAYERDGVVFHQRQAQVGLLAALLAIADRRGSLRVADFGGSLGSAWLQHCPWLKAIPRCSWTVIEQPGFVAAGQRLFRDGSVQFAGELDPLLTANLDVVLIGSTLQYLPDPEALIRRIAASPVAHLVLDRTAFTPGHRHRLTVQQVDPRIYRASYPAWFLGHDRIQALLTASGFRAEFTWRTDDLAPDVGDAFFAGGWWSRPC